MSTCNINNLMPTVTIQVQL